MQKQISWLGFALLSVSLISCATAPPDVPLCAEIHMSKGFCVHTISSKEFIVDDDHLFDGKTWWEMRPLMVHMPHSSWAQIKSYIIKQCKRTGQCDKAISSWERTIESVDKAVTQK